MYAQQSFSSLTISPRRSERKKIPKDVVEGKEVKNLQETEKGAERTKTLLNEAGKNPKKHVLCPGERKLDDNEEMEVLWLVSPHLRPISSRLSNTAECTRRCGQRTSGRTSSICSRTKLVSCGVVSDQENRKSYSSCVIQAISSPQHTSLEMDSRSLRESWSSKLMTLCPRTESNELLKKGRGMRASSRSRTAQHHREGRGEEDGALKMEPPRLRSSGGIALGRRERKRARISPEKRGSKVNVPSSPPIIFSTLVPCPSLMENEGCLEEVQKEREAESSKAIGFSFEKINSREEKLGEPSLENDKEEAEGGGKRMPGSVEVIQSSVNPLDPVPSSVFIERVDKVRDKDKVEKMRWKKEDKEEAMREEQWRHSTRFPDVNSAEDSSSLDLCTRTLFIPPYSSSCFTDPLLKESELEKVQHSCEIQEEENTEGVDKSEMGRKAEKKPLSEKHKRLSTSPLPSSRTKPLDLGHNLNTESSDCDGVAGIPLCPTTFVSVSLVSSPFIQSSFSSNKANESLSLSCSRVVPRVDEKSTSLRVSTAAAHLEEFSGLEVRENKTPLELRKGSHHMIPPFFCECGEAEDLLKGNVNEAENADENSIYSFPLVSSSPPSLSPTLPPQPSPSAFSTSKTSPFATISSNKHEHLSIREDELRTQVYELFTRLHVFFS